MAIHNFAIDVEHTENFALDEFYKEGLRIIEAEHAAGDVPDMNDQGGEESARVADLELFKGRYQREIHKDTLFEYLDSMDVGN